MDTFPYVMILCPGCKQPILITLKRLCFLLAEERNLIFGCSQDCLDDIGNTPVELFN